MTETTRRYITDRTAAVRAIEMARQKRLSELQQKPAPALKCIACGAIVLVAPTPQNPLSCGH